MTSSISNHSVPTSILEAIEPKNDQLKTLSQSGLERGLNRRRSGPRQALHFVKYAKSLDEIPSVPHFGADSHDNSEFAVMLEPGFCCRQAKARFGRSGLCQIRRMIEL